MAVKNDLQMDKGRYEYFLEKYKGKIKPEILKQYKDPDEYVLINEDKNLHPIWIKLPEPPEWHTIDGWGKPAKEQKFQYQEFPKKLQKLVDSCVTIEEIWEALEDRQMEFKDEIAWIRRQWKRYENGYWFFCNGKPTVLVGWHYVYLNFWRFKGNKQPEYRDRNRKFMWAMYYAYTTTETVCIDERGFPEYIDEKRRILKMRDTGFRTCLGIAYPKHRKDGASNMCLCAEYMEVITHIGVVGGIVSMTGAHAKEKLFDEIIVPGWGQMPFFFKPKTTSNQNPGSEIKFNASRSSANKLKKDELDSKVSYSETSDSTLYDGGNNIWINVDETGKTTSVPTFDRHRQLKPCVSLGNGANIFGFLTYPSTVGEMLGKGGKEFFRICKDSYFEQRDISGQTKSGMFVLYMPATEGLDGFIGPYGESVVDDPTPEQAAFIGKNYGSRAHLQNKRDQLIASNDMEGYNEEVRLFPITYMECFRTEDGDIGFNTKIINDRLEVLVYEYENLVQRGNFKREMEQKDGRVYWERDDQKGRFILSKQLNPDQTNRQYIRSVGGVKVRFPYEPKFTCSADPFKFNVTQGGRMSLGGGASFWDYDHTIDGGQEMKYWKSHRFVCTYLYRPEDKDDFAEDMLMMTVYFGGRMYPEIDYPLIWDYFEKRGYGGYLKYDMDSNGNVKKTPGFNSKGSKQSLFNNIRDYIQHHGHREVHKDFLNQCKDISDMDEMTDYDLITTCGGCLTATTGMIDDAPREEKKKQQSSIQSLIPKRRYGG